MHITITLRAVCAAAFAFISLSAAAQSKDGLEAQCAKGLDAAYAELDVAKAKGVGGVADMSWAASLLAAAKTQQQFGKYPNCVEKVNSSPPDYRSRAIVNEPSRAVGPAARSTTLANCAVVEGARPSVDIDLRPCTRWMLLADSWLRMKPDRNR